MTEQEGPREEPRVGRETDNRLRLFVAIPLPEEIRTQVTGLSRNLQKGFTFTASHPSWSPVETMHLTLIFLGAMEPDKLDGIKHELDFVGERFAPLRIEIKRLGVFPHWHNPRVLWAGVRERTHQIESLHRLLEFRLEGLGYEPEEREYHPHLTLARFKSAKAAHAAESIVNEHQGFKFGPFMAPEMVLFQSVLNPSGAQHTPLHRAAFKAAPKSNTQDEDTES